MLTELTPLFENYIDECRFVLRLRPETVRSSVEAFRHFTAIVPEVRFSHDLSPDIVTLFFKRLQTRERLVGRMRVVGVKDSTVRAYGSRLKTFFKWLYTRRSIPNNPFDFVRLPNPSYTDKRALGNQEIKRIMGAVAQHTSSAIRMKRDLAMISVFVFCGLRRRELISLEIRDVDLTGGLLTVRGETSKSKRTRRIPINIHLRMYLSEYLDERRRRGCNSEYLFVSSTTDHELTLHGLKHWVERLSARSGVKFHVHRFRHTFATNLAMQDVGAVKIQNLMGHSQLSMTQKYLRSVSTEEMRDDVNKLSFENLR